MSISISILNKSLWLEPRPFGSAEIAREPTGNFPGKWFPVGKCSLSEGSVVTWLVEPFAKGSWTLC